MVKFIMNSTYFTFNSKYYKQSFGTPMGSPLSPIIADSDARPGTIGFGFFTF